MDEMIPREESKAFLEDQSLPVWFRLLNVDASRWEKSVYAKDSMNGSHRLKDIDILKQMDPHEYQAAVDNVKEYNQQLEDTKASKRDYRLGRLMASIPAKFMALNPELATDPKALDEFLSKHPELRTKG